MEAELGICIPSTHYHYSLDQILESWEMCMHCQIEDMFNRNDESKLVLRSSLTYLQISSCIITSDSLSTSIEGLVSLSKLELFEVRTIISLPPKEVLSSLENLQTLTIEGCSLLSSLGGIGEVTSLKALKLNGCINFRTSNEPLPSSLDTLEFYDCSNVDVILAKSNLPLLCTLNVGQITFKNRRGVLRVGHLSFLKELSIDGRDGQMEGLNSLMALYIFRVWRFPVINLSSPMDKCASALQNFTVDNPLLLKLMLSDESIFSIENLVIHSFQGGDSLDDEVFQSLTSLKRLFFIHCNITHLPKNLKNLASLEYMKLDNCPNLCELEELPTNLHTLEIENCPPLMAKFKKDGPNYQVFFYKGRTFLAFCNF